ncbi:UPF0546 membrane protein [Dichotomocladium elegans]|nr:UPF0546 membrane protein [Dichotomocladium elegans]
MDLTLVAICWGATNPLIKAGAAGLDHISQKYPQPGLHKWYVLPLVLNLSGSVVYYYTLGQSEMSLAVPITNSLTFLFSLFTGLLLGEELGGRDTWLGMALILSGVLICIASKI